MNVMQKPIACIDGNQFNGTPRFEASDMTIRVPQSKATAAWPLIAGLFDDIDILSKAQSFVFLWIQIQGV